MSCIYYDQCFDHLHQRALLLISGSVMEHVKDFCNAKVLIVRTIAVVSNQEYGHL